MSLNRRKVILENKFVIEGRTVMRIELREYKLSDIDQDEAFSIVIYLKTDLEDIELDYLGKPTSDRDKFEESFNFLCNYNGLSLALNRLFIELDSRIR
ncbi:MAG: hypothetical protein L0H53_14510 [Candidatus Nitrosocosmicus sp.]|nr:hypothetical protein [Candidatus Nitrosocosmicus sp.]